MMKLTILILSIFLSGCANSVSREEFDAFKAKNFEWQVIQGDEMARLRLDVDSIKEELPRKIESTDEFFHTMDLKMEDLLARRTEKRFSDIREYLENSCKKG